MKTVGVAVPEQAEGGGGDPKVFGLVEASGGPGLEKARRQASDGGAARTGGGRGEEEL